MFPVEDVVEGEDVGVWMGVVLAEEGEGVDFLRDSLEAFGVFNVLFVDGFDD